MLVFGLPDSHGTLAGIPTLSKARHEVIIVSVVVLYGAKFTWLWALLGERG